MNQRQVRDNLKSLRKQRAAISRLAGIQKENALINSGKQVTGDVGDTDLAADLGEQSVVLTLVNMEGKELKKMDAALERAHEGRYGICEVCGEKIDSKRLASIPEAACCTRCEPVVPRDSP